MLTNSDKPHRWLPKFRAMTLAAIVVALNGCGAIPTRMAVPTDKQVAHCAVLLGPHWEQIQPPLNADELLEMPEFHPWQKGIIWFSITTDRVAACAFTDDKNGCGFSSHEFTRVGERWSHSIGPLFERICTVG